MREHLCPRCQASKRKVASGAIHIDHIVPASAFDLLDAKEVRACYSLGNLRPMWASKNIAKGAGRVYLL